MEATFFILALGILFSVDASARDGAGTSGGGGAFACWNADGTIRDAELVDLWEARNLDGQEIPTFPQDKWEQASGAVARLREFHPGLAKVVDLDLAVVRQKFFFVPPNVQLAPPNDVNPIYQKPGCPLFGMMYFDNVRGRLAVDQKIFGALLSETERAAALVHEAVYKTMRENRLIRAKDSVSSRKIVGCLFARDYHSCLGYEPRSTKVPAEGDLYRCRVEYVDSQVLVNVSPAEHWGEDTAGREVKKWRMTVVFEKLAGEEVANAIYSFRDYIENWSGKTMTLAYHPGQWSMGGLSEAGMHNLGYDLALFNPFAEHRTDRSRKKMLGELKSGAKVEVEFGANEGAMSLPLQCEKIR